MSPTKEYEWNPNDALGDTIGEKFESLFLLFLDVYNEFCYDAIVSDEDIMAMAVCSSFFEHNLDPDTDMDDPVYMGQFPHKPWKFYQSERLHREIILADTKGRYVLIKVVDF